MLYIIFQSKLTIICSQFDFQPRPLSRSVSVRPSLELSLSLLLLLLCFALYWNGISLVANIFYLNTQHDCILLYACQPFSHYHSNSMVLSGLIGIQQTTQTQHRREREREKRRTATTTKRRRRNVNIIGLMYVIIKFVYNLLCTIAKIT